MEVLVFLGVAALVALVAWYSWHAKQRRRQQLAEASLRLGLRFAPIDPFGLLGLPFALLTKGDGRGVENVLWGTWQGMDVREFDYWYYEESTDSNGRTSRTYHRFSCAVTELPIDGAHLTVEPEGLFTRLADHLGFHDIEFESEEFNRAFQVQCRDRKFATDVIDARMMGWLMQSGKGWAFEVSGPYVLCRHRRLAPAELVPLLGTLRGFLAHVPRVVHDLYGTPRTG